MELIEKPPVLAGGQGAPQQTVISELLSSTGAAAKAVNGKVIRIHSPASDTSSKQKMNFFAMANEMHNSSHSDSGNDPFDSCLNHLPASSGYGTAPLSQLKVIDPLQATNFSKLLNDPKNLNRNADFADDDEQFQTMQGIDTDIFSNPSSNTSAHEKNSVGENTSDNQAHSEDQLSIPSPKLPLLQRPISNSDPTLFTSGKSPEVLGLTTVKKVNLPARSVVAVTKEGEDLCDQAEIVNVVSTQNVSSSEDSSDRSTCGHPPGVPSDEEPIITVLASNGRNRNSAQSSHRSSVCSDSSHEKTNYRERLARFHTGILQQGKLMTGGASSSDSLLTGELSVSQFTLGQKHRFFTDNSLKRPSTNVAKKKVVEAKLVHPVRTTAKVEKVIPSKYEQKLDQPYQTTPDMATTAALAAASVVAASQPFLQVQQNLDQKVTELNEKISAMANSGQRQPDEQYSQATEARIKFLENQVESLTNKRLEYLEYMQKHQMYIQDRLVRANEKQQDEAKIVQSKENQKPLVIFKEVLPDDKRPLARISRSEPTLHAHDKSMLDTPAPRRKPPSPTSYETQNKGEIKQHTPEKTSKKDPGFLAKILATPEQSPSNPMLLRDQNKDYPLKNRLGSNHTINRAKELERSMDNLNEQLRCTVFPTEVDTEIADRRHPEGPYPIDYYLVDNMEPLPSSPYPDLATVRGGNKSQVADVKGNAPVVAKYMDAQSTLRQAQTLQQHLEGNLDAVLRSRQELDLFSGKTMMNEGKVEDLRVKKMVDKHIKSMNAEIERDIMKKLLEVNEKYDKKNSRASRMIPERDTTAPPKKFKARPAPVQTKPKTTMSKPVKPVPPVPVFKKPSKQSTKYKDTMPCHLLHKPFSAEKTQKTKASVTRQPPPHVIPAPKPVYQPPIPKYVSLQGQIVPVAIPLRSPRKNTFPQPPAPTPSPGPVMTSTPVMGQSHSVLPQSPQTQPSVRSLSPTRVVDNQPSPTIGFDLPPGPQLRMDEQEDTFTTVDGEQPLSSDKIEIDGEAAVVEKPKVTLWEKQLKEKNQKHLTLLQDRACKWVGQELLAQLTRELYSPSMTHQDTIPHDQVTPDSVSDEDDHDEHIKPPSDVRAKTVAPSTSGPQVIINPGVNMDDKLVNALLKEVLMERLKSSIVSRPGPIADEATDVVGQPVAHSPQPASPPSSVMNAFNQPPMREEYQFSPPTTPELTPQHSPVPPLMSSSPGGEHKPGIPHNPTPDITPAASIADDYREPPVYSSDFESEEEEKIPLKTLNGVALDDTEDTFGGARHSLSTPEITPPPTPPSQERMPYVSPPRTPSPSLAQPSLEPSLDVPDDAEAIKELPVDGPQTNADPAVIDMSKDDEQPPSIEEVESVHEEVDEKPEMKSVGIDVAESLSLPAATSPHVAPSSPVSSDTPSLSSPVSDTINEHLSEGQWLISVQSEGEIPMRDDSDLQELVLKKCLAGTRVGKRRDSNDDTLMDTEELEPDHEKSEMEVSEGEFLFRGQAAPNKFSDFDINPEFKKPPPRIVNVAPPQNGGPTDVSLGEVSIGQRLVSDKGGRRDAPGLKNFSRAFSSDRTPEPQPEDDKQASPLGVSDDDDASEAGAVAQPKVTVRSPSPIQRHSPISRGGLSGTYPTGNRGKPMGGMIMSTGMPRGDRGGRFRSGISGQHPQRTNRNMSPEPRRTSATLSGELADMLSSRDSFQATQSDLETRTMTPDQMNVEALLQSKDYFSTTQSDFGSTDFTTHGDEPTEATANDEGGTPTPSPRSKPRQVSVTIPSMVEEDESESVEDVSEYT